MRNGFAFASHRIGRRLAGGKPRPLTFAGGPALARLVGLKRAPMRRRDPTQGDAQWIYFYYSTLTPATLNSSATPLHGHVLLLCWRDCPVLVASMITYARFNCMIFRNVVHRSAGHLLPACPRSNEFFNAGKTHMESRSKSFPLRPAHYIAAPSTPDAVVAEASDRVTAGNIPTAAEVKDLICEARTSGKPGR